MKKYCVMVLVLLGLMQTHAVALMLEPVKPTPPPSPIVEYEKAVRSADAAFKAGKYVEAKKLYSIAAQKNSKSTHPVAQIAKINKILDEMTKAGAYDSALSKADAALASQNYEEAQGRYNQALAIKPLETYPQAKLKEVLALLLDVAYNTALQKADANLAAQQLDEAQAAYEEAYGLKPELPYARDKLAELSKLRDEQAKEVRYQSAILNANNHYTAKRLKDAELALADALSIKPNDAYSLGQLQKIKDFRKAEAETETRRQAERARAAIAEKVALANKQYEGRFGVRFSDCPDCPTMVPVKAGFYRMGSPEGTGNNTEWPQHEVSISRPFAVGVFEVTFNDWDACVKEGACTDPKVNDAGWGRDKRPLIFASWQDAQVYVKWLQRKTGKPYRLLTEAEWEYIARAGSDGNYWWGNSIESNRANCNGCGSPFDNSKTATVGSFMPNAFGVYDTAGNVWEWVEDCYNADYSAALRDGSAWLDRCESPNVRTLRGGSWGASPNAVRSSFRKKSSQVIQLDDYGFRVAYTLESAAN